MELFSREIKQHCSSSRPNRRSASRSSSDTGGHHTWTDEEIAQFQAHYPIGTKARLALELMLWQGMRRSDVIRVRRQHMKDGEITLTQRKTGTEVRLPSQPVSTTEAGKPY